MQPATRTIVYHGPGMAGKTSTLQSLHKQLPPTSCSDITSQGNEFYRMLSMEVHIDGQHLHLTTIPGCVLYTHHRTKLLHNADGIIFVMDSQKHKLEENLHSVRECINVLKAQQRDIKNIPIIFQYNKRDVPDALPVAELDRYLNPMRWPTFETVAVRHTGVLAAYQHICSRIESRAKT